MPTEPQSGIRPDTADLETHNTTRGELLAVAARRLRAAGVESPRLDAELLLGQVLGVTRTSLVARPEIPLSLEEYRAFFKMIEQRDRRVPLPYILGRQAFRDFTLSVAPGVMIPRPETELLVDIAVTALPLTRDKQPIRIVDVGTGSGAVAIALARLRPDSQICATDSSNEALAIATANAESLLGNDRIQFLHGSLLAPIDPGWAGTVDLIVSNPPYIPTAWIETLQPEVAQFEPRAAVDGGLDGLDVIRGLVTAAPDWLAPEGVLVFEIAQGQGPSTIRLLNQAGYRSSSAARDLAGIERVVMGRKPALPGDQR